MATTEERTGLPAPLPSRASTGVAGLDDVLHGGLLRDRLYLVHGAPGAGKTTLALQFLLAGVRLGERCLYITLSETSVELADGAASHGWDLSGMDVVELIAEELQLDGEGDLTMYHPSEVDFTRTTQRILEAVDAVRPRRMVLDSLSEMRLLAQSSLRYRRQIMAIKQYFIDRGCTVLLLDDRTADGPDGQLESLAHGVIALEHRAPDYGAVLRQVEVAKFRGSAFRTGRHDFAIDRGGLRVFPRLAANEHVAGLPPSAVSSGIASLDALTGGGVDRGTTTLLIGPAGSGKSTLALQHARVVAAAGGHADVFLFEEALGVMLARLEGLGMSFPLGNGPGQVAVRQLDPAEVSPGEFAALVREAVERRDCRLLVVDSLNGYLNAMPGNRELAMQLHELLAYLHNRGVTTFIVSSQVGIVGGTVQAPIDASYLADNIIVLRFYEHAGRLSRAIAMVKKRTGRHERAIRELRFDETGIHVGPPLEGMRGVFGGAPEAVTVQSGNLLQSKE
jgi:circadian clock protein KaiC